MRTLFPIAFLAAFGSAASAQCPLWVPDLTGTRAPNGAIRAAIVFDEDGPGPLPLSLYVGGDFTQIGGVTTGCVARFDGTNWFPVGPVLAGSHVSSFALWDPDGSGGLPECLYASGNFPAYYHGGSVAGYVLGSWANLSGFVHNDPDAALAVYDEDGPGQESPRLYMAGAHLHNLDVNGGLHPWGDFLSGSLPGQALAACVFDADGAGPQLPLLIITGNFTTLAGSLPAAGVFQWDGGHGNSGTFAGGLIGPGAVGQSLLARDDPSTGQPELIVAGRFNGAGGVGAPGIASWESGGWSPLGSGFALGANESIRALQLFDRDGAGPGALELYAGGSFTLAGGTSAANLARFDGTSWFDVGGGVGGSIASLAVFDPDAAGPIPRALYAAGTFGTAGGLPAAGLAHFVDHPCPIVVCAGDGTLPTPCPCGNFGASGHGCGNSAQAQGAALGASGPPHPDLLQLDLSFAPGGANGLFVQLAAQSPQGNVLGDGLACFSGTLRRLGVRTCSPSGDAAYPGAGPTIGQRSAALGDPLQPGDVRYYQVVYRDGAAGFCVPSGTFNLSNGLRVYW